MKKAIVIMMMLAAGVAAAQERTQTVALAKGWNAVWLEVQPADATPAAVVAGLPVDIVAGYVLPVSQAQFVKNTVVNMQTLAGWNVWYAPHRADAPLSRLHQMSADMGYLVHALEAAVVNVRGTVSGAELKWTPSRFNLVGFTVAPQGGPTFRQLFEASSAHNHNKIYRLANGVWRQVLAPDAEAPRPGEAFWVWSEGGSSYQGPLLAKGNSPMGVVLADGSQGELTLGNASKYPLAFTLSLVVDDANAEIPMSAVIKVVAPNVTGLLGLADAPVDFPGGAWTQAFPEYLPGDGVALPLTLRLKDMLPGKYSGLLKVKTDVGTETWIPVHATKE
jgi:hypothetical protein